MRFIPTFCIREGMIVARNIYDSNGQLMLANGVQLDKVYIKSIIRLQYNGIYIEDNLSRDITIVNVISEELKNNTIKGIKDVFMHNDKNIKGVERKIEITKKLVEDIVNEILENKNLLVNIVDLKVFDDYTFYHSVNVTVLSILMGVAINLSKKELYQLGIGALLHDIGKIFIDKKILNKPGKLTEFEFEEMKQHSRLGYDYLKKEFDISTQSYLAVLDHHEKYSGEGYPSNKKQNEISLFGRIITIADVYDAVTSDRPYRLGLLPSEAMEYIMGGSSTLFDPELVKIFIRKVAPYPIGTCVKLSNGLTGIVIENNENLCLRPKLRIFKNKTGFIEPYLLNLSSDPGTNSITIINVAKM